MGHLRIHPWKAAMHFELPTVTWLFIPASPSSARPLGGFLNAAQLVRSFRCLLIKTERGTYGDSKLNSAAL